MKYLYLFEEIDLVSHLKDRGIDNTKTRVVLDEESGDTFFFLYNLSGQMVGYQKYNPNYEKKGQRLLNNPRMAKYYNWVGDEGYGKKIAVWGLESYNETDKYLFITEGIFDIARAHEAGYPGIAVLCNNPSQQLCNWLETLPQTKIVIYDNDKAGRELIKLGDYAYSIDSGKDLNDLDSKSAKLFLDKIINNLDEKKNESTIYGNRGISNTNTLEMVEDMLIEIEDLGMNCRMWVNSYRQGTDKKEENRKYNSDLNKIDIEINHDGHNIEIANNVISRIDRYLSSLSWKQIEFIQHGSYNYYEFEKLK